MNTTVLGVLATAIVGVATVVIGYLTNKRQGDTANRSQALVEVQAVWERLDDLEGRLEDEKRKRETERVEQRTWRRKAVAYIHDLTAAIQRGDKRVPPLPTDFELE